MHLKEMDLRVGLERQTVGGYKGNSGSSLPRSKHYGWESEVA